MDKKPVLLLLALSVASLGHLGAAEAGHAQDGAGGLQASNEFDDLGLVRHDAGTMNNSADDVFLLDVDDNNEISQRDLVLGTSGHAQTRAGEILTTQHDALFTQGTLVPAYVLYADIDASGAYSDGDWVYVSGFPADLVATGTTHLRDYSIRLSDTTGGAKWSMVLAGDPDLATWGTIVDDDLGGGPKDASFAWLDDDLDGSLDIGESAYVTPDSVETGDPVPPLSIQITRDHTGDEDPSPQATAGPVKLGGWAVSMIALVTFGIGVVLGAFMMRRR